MGSKIDTPTTERFLVQAINRVHCDKHMAPHGIPCFRTPKGNGYGYYAGICNNRALRAGFNGKIDKRSLSLPPKRAPKAA